MPHVSYALPGAAASFLLCHAVVLAQAALPPLLAPIAQPPAAAVAWDAAERARNPMLVQTTFVQVDTAALRALPPGGAPPLGSFRLDLFAQPVAIDITSTSWTLGYRVFRGNVPGQGSDLVLTLAPTGELSAAIDVGDLQFAIAPAGAPGVHVLQRIDAGQMTSSMGCGTDASHGVNAPVPVGSSLVATANSDCSLTTFDVLICYTPQARIDAGGTAAMEATLVGAIEQANSAHRDSGAPVEFRLVHMAETNYTEVGTGTDLSRFRNTSDGFMDEVHALRNDYGADLMHLVIAQSSAFCGIGYLMGNVSTGFNTSAFGVTVRTCIPNRTLTHEIGHNMGCHHDAPNAGGTPAFPYSYGYRTPNDQYRTIMAYAPGTRVNLWSSPNVVYQGFTMGVAGSADNALSITNVAATVAQFRSTQAPQWCQLGGGIAAAAGKPTLIGSGTINQVAPLQLHAANYGPLGVGLLILGAAPINVPLFGGTLVPSIDFTETLVGSGAPIAHDASWLATQAPGFQAWCQVAFLDLAAPQGWSASDAVRVTRP
jgi:hypothetical protein